MMTKKILATVCVMIFTINSVSASILGTTLRDSAQIRFSDSVVVQYNKFLSDQSGVGNQSEYYAVYTPNEKVVPVVMTGGDIYGKRTVTQAIEYMKNNGMVPMIGINASFFSLQTGIPMGHTVTEGIVTSKDDRALPAIGFREDSTAFIDNMSIITTATFGDDYSLQIPHINKYISSETQMLTMYTPDFGVKTGTNTQTLNIVLSNLTDSIRIGGELSCIVEKIFISDTPVDIEKDKAILSINTNGNQWAITLLNTLKEGDEIKISTTANSDKWNGIKNALASEGKRLLENSEVSKPLNAGSSPRTAVGIKDNGEVVFYVLDGRQNGYSYGAREETIAKRLLELGCVDAINLDGGGSTTIAGIYPGCDVTQVMNSPSDGTQRKVTNFIFLQNLTKPSQTPAYAYIYPYRANILSGSKMKLTVKTVDENYHPTNHSSVSFTVNDFGKINENEELTASGEGKIVIDVTADCAKGSVTYNSYNTPETIKVLNSETNSILTQIDVKPGDVIKLNAKAWMHGEEMISDNNAFLWTLSNTENASIDENGELKIFDNFNDEILLNVKAGEKEINIPVVSGASVNNPANYPYCEILVDKSKLVIEIKSESEPIDKKSSYYKIDGKKISLSDAQMINDNHLRKEINVDENFSNQDHNVVCVSVLKNGNTSIKSYNVLSGKSKNVFSDTTGHWAEKIISYMSEMGIVNGSVENSWNVYRPNGNVTRAEFAVMTVKYLGINIKDYEDIDLSEFVDEKTIPQWAKGYIKAAYSNSLITGKLNNNKLYIEPSANITREEAFTILSRVLPPKLRISDVNYVDKAQISDWAQKPFKILATSGLINGYEDNTIRPKNKVTRAEAVTMLYNIF